MKNEGLMQVNNSSEIHIRVDLLYVQKMLHKLHCLLRRNLHLKKPSEFDHLISKLATELVRFINMIQRDDALGFFANHIHSVFK